MLRPQFISFHDLSPDACFLYASPSVVDVLGYTAEEILGTSPYLYVHPDTQEIVRNMHSTGVRNDKVAVIMFPKFMTKSGKYVIIEAIFTVCYDVIVSCNSVKQSLGSGSQELDPNAELLEQQRERRSHMLEIMSQKFKWEISSLHPEPRCCMILNRFTRSHTILFSTGTIEFLFGLNPKECVGTSFLSYVHPDFQEEVNTNIEAAKSENSIAVLRFVFLSPRNGEVDVEAALSASSDGIVVVLRHLNGDLREYILRQHPAIQEIREEYHGRLKDEDIEASTIAAEMGVCLWPDVARRASISSDEYNGYSEEDNASTSNSSDLVEH
ncbi:uncharacterized protein VTP21DRAFT_6613 [Calcarisporiella thermophila]|uniref:uncharacterized protein n=1 Tax=Calcarisporiella thermophila TaxID=911321 RepID=UPI0037449918